MESSFKAFFNKKRQFYEVYLWSVHPNTFDNWKGGRWGYFVYLAENPRLGKFGEIHLVESRVRVDSVSHELDHLRCAWIFKNGITLSTRNEEWFCKFGDELTRNFWREYDKFRAND